MLIVNADDFGRCRVGTDRIVLCYRKGSVTSASAMVFMEDSERAADLAKENSMKVGLHLNFTQELILQVSSSILRDHHRRIMSFLAKNKYNFLIYNPGLRRPFEYVVKAQIEEFERLYGEPPGHIDGHHHMHLCANMLVRGMIPNGLRVRRNFTFAQGEKSFLNRAYRAAIDKWLTRRYVTTDYLFSLSERIKTGRLVHALEIARKSWVELETHPEVQIEFEWLKGSAFVQAIFSQES
jgi:predicted glycoside hydrolase/deacetylase ChbG (UPF0249 family)